MLKAFVMEITLYFFGTSYYCSARLGTSTKEKKKTGEKKRDQDKEICVDPGEQREDD